MPASPSPSPSSPELPAAARQQPPRSALRRRALWAAALGTAASGLALGLGGCAAFNHVGPDSPLPLDQVPAGGPAPRVALVLGSGGPRGYAHIGVLRVLEDAAVPVDLVVGSSVGALIGAFWASGLDAAEIDQRSQAGGPLTLFDISPFADRGWIRGQRLQDYVNDQLGSPLIERLPRRLVVRPRAGKTRRRCSSRAANLGVAVRASSAVPAVISPVGIQGTEYEDADESLPVAVRAARQAGARFVIAVDVSARPGTAPPGMPAAMLARDDVRRSRIDPEVALADFLIHAELPYLASPSERYFKLARTAGEQTARQQLPQLRAALQRAGLVA